MVEQASDKNYWFLFFNNIYSKKTDIRQMRGGGAIRVGSIDAKILEAQMRLYKYDP